MAKRLIAIRPAPGLTETISAAEDLGLDCFGEALFDIKPCDWDCPDAATLDGLLIGSANAIRHGGPQLDRLADLPVYAVGARTAECALEAGFLFAQTGQGGLQQLIDKLPDKPIKLLRLAGKERITLTPPPQLGMTERVVYEVSAQPMSRELQGKLGADSMVLIHSAAAARHFATECERCSVDRSEVSLAVLGPRIADAAGDGWGSIYVSTAPNDAALLALAADICQ